jgi:hypothetical protein
VKRRFQIAIRRALYSALTLLIVTALVAPLQTGESAGAPLPACCLVHGDHHCMGQVPAGDAGAPGLTAASLCPYSPLALAALQGQSIAPATDAGALITGVHSTRLMTSAGALSIFRIAFTHFERGPPNSSF